MIPIPNDLSSFSLRGIAQEVLELSEEPVHGSDVAGMAVRQRDGPGPRPEPPRDELGAAGVEAGRLSALHEQHWDVAQGADPPDAVIVLQDRVQAREGDPHPAPHWPSRHLP